MKRPPDICVPLNVGEISLITFALALMTQVEPDADEICDPLVRKMNDCLNRTRLTEFEEETLEELTKAAPELHVTVVRKMEKDGGPWMN